VLKPHPDTQPNFPKVMAPGSVVVVGASPTHQWGRVVLENFSRINYGGKVVAVNPKYDEIAGYPCYASIAEIPFVPDSAMVSVNRERVVPVIEEAAAKGIKGAVVIAIGFAEAGDEGRANQERLTAVAREAQMSIIGPNCQGVVNFTQPSAQYMDKVHPYEPGPVALFAQSGSVATALTNNPRGVRWSHIVSCGNEAVSGSADLLGYFVDDPQTSIIAGFIETIRRPEQFFHECERAYEAGKPIVILKSGRTEAARRMATTHSGALSAPDRLVDELLKRHHVLRVDSMEELLETVLALGGGKQPAGNRLAVVTASGGQIELILDEFGKYDLQLPTLASHTQATLRAMLPDFLQPTNPLDYWGIPDYRGAYPKILRALAEDPSVDVVVGFVDTTFGPTGDEGRARFTIQTAAEISAETDTVIALVSNLDGSVSESVARQAQAEKVIFLSGLPVGLRAIERLITYAKPRPRSGSTPPDDPGLAARTSRLGSKPVSGLPALEFLRSAGLPTVQTVEVGSADEAGAAARRLGFPVVAKIGDVDVLHKTEAGGVLLDLADEGAVRSAYQLLRTAGANRVLVQTQVNKGLEIILGLTTDERFGTFILAGLGGIWIEVLDDVAIRPVGLREGEAEAMVSELRSSRWLEGLRGSPPLDRGALVAAIEALDRLGQAQGSRLLSLDVNPLIVLPEGAVAVDAVVVPREA
jgi:acyl-CoA synthetase (NDP forming)